MSLNIEINEKDECIEAYLDGEIDINTVEYMKEIISQAVDKYKSNIVIQCNNLDYIDSLGLGAFVSVLKKNKEHGKDVYFKGLKKNILKLFTITGLDKVFIIEECK